jgi:hypothetical protein
MRIFFLKYFIVLGLLATCCASKAAVTDSVKVAKRLKWKTESSNKGSIYLYWGYNRAWFTHSDIHFAGPEYDMTFYDLKAKDRPSKFSFDAYFKNLSVPQYNFRLGYFVTNNLHLSFGIDHMKYVVNNDQLAKYSGAISPSFSPTYGGTHFLDTISLTEHVLRFEHTNGLNLISFDVEYLQPVANLYRHKLWLKWNFGVGGVWVITKTDLKVFDDGIDNRFHLSGYSVTAKTGPRLEFWHWAFIASEVKAGYMTLPDVLINNDQPKRANHNFGFLEFYIVAGVQVPINRIIAHNKAKHSIAK